MNAYESLLAYLAPGEEVEGLILSNCDNSGPAISINEQGKLMSLWEARPILTSMNSFQDTDHGLPQCPSLYVWTSYRVIFVVKYDGQTWLASVPRRPQEDMYPGKFGGG